MRKPAPATPHQPGTKPDERAFTVDAALLFQLGEELVNRRSVALAELIKNAYDADAALGTIPRGCQGRRPVRSAAARLVAVR